MSPVTRHFRTLFFRYIVIVITSMLAASHASAQTSDMQSYPDGFILCEYPSRSNTQYIIDNSPIGVIRGRITDQRGQPVFSAIISILKKGELVGRATTDGDGNFVLNYFQSGNVYDIKIHSIGYRNRTIQGVALQDMTQLNLVLKKLSGQPKNTLNNSSNNKKHRSPAL